MAVTAKKSKPYGFRKFGIGVPVWVSAKVRAAAYMFASRTGLRFTSKRVKQGRYKLVRIK